MSDEKTPAERLAETMWPASGSASIESTAVDRAIAGGWMDEALALERGWTPPSDPHEDIARELAAAMWTQDADDPFPADNLDRDLLAAVRRMDLRRGDQ